MWEERWHPLREEWVIVAAHRQSRPWSGAELAAAAPRPPAFDPACYLCPGNARVSGAVNPSYTGTFVFDNDHPCVGAHAPHELVPPAGIYRNRPATGVARVVCYSPQHDVTLAELEIDGVDALLHTWQEQMRELATHSDVEFVLVFENKGEAVGVSNPHPHCQIYATNFTFKYIETELAVGRRHLDDTGRILFQDILAAERQDGRRAPQERPDRRCAR
jgi:UDPglucose--hexose-1-phosphate uridylyltransferase